MQYCGCVTCSTIRFCYFTLLVPKLCRNVSFWGHKASPYTAWVSEVVGLSVWGVGVRGHQGWVGRTVNDRKIPHTFSARSTLKHWPLLSPVATQPLQALATLKKPDTRRSAELREPNYIKRWQPAQACVGRLPSSFYLIQTKRWVR